MREDPAPSFECFVEPSEGGDGHGGDSCKEEEVFKIFISCVHERSQVISEFAEKGGEIEEGVECSCNRIVVYKD